MSYQSPINIIYDEVRTKLENDITVNKEELLKALYNKGWSEGWLQCRRQIKYLLYKMCLANIIDKKTLTELFNTLTKEADIPTKVDIPTVSQILNKIMRWEK